MPIICVYLPMKSIIVETTHQFIGREVASTRSITTQCLAVTSWLLVHVDEWLLLSVNRLVHDAIGKFWPADYSSSFGLIYSATYSAHHSAHADTSHGLYSTVSGSGATAFPGSHHLHTPAAHGPLLFWYHSNTKVYSNQRCSAGCFTTDHSVPAVVPLRFPSLIFTLVSRSS